MEAVVSRPIKRGKKAVLSSDVTPQSPSDVDIGMGDTPFVRPTPPAIEPVDTPLSDDYEAQLKFNEDGITIMVHPSTDPNAPLFVEASVNGKGIERWIPGLNRFAEVKHIPVGEQVTVKRKYVEVLLRSKDMQVVTVEDKMDGSEPRNLIRRVNRANYVIQVFRDPSPLGTEWMMRLAAMV